MRSVRMKGLQALLAAVALVAAACGGVGSAASPTPDPLGGNYTASGGGAALAAVQALTKRFNELHHSVNWTFENVGSDASIQLVAASSTDLGFISRDLKDSENGTVELLRIGASGTAVVVNAKNPVAGLTKQQVRDIFSGKITDWKDVGGTGGPIRVFIREANAATRDVFEAYFFGGKATYAKGVTEVVEFPETVKAIGSFEGSIGMITLDARSLAEPSIKLVSIDGIPATLDSLHSDSWQIRRPLYIVYQPDRSKRKPAIDAFLEFVRGPEGQKILAGF